MNTKLTLKLDAEVIDRTKRYARERGVSLSGMVESYFRGVTAGSKGTESRPAGVVAELAGALAGVEVDESRSDYAGYLAEKYS